MIADYVREQPVERSAAIVLPIFRAIAVSWVAGTWPTQGAAVAAPAADAAVFAASDAAVFAAAASSSAPASAEAAAYAAASASSSVPYAPTAADTAFAASSAPASAPANAPANAAAIWAEIKADADALEAGQQTETLMGRPLWTDGAPEWAEANWAKLKIDLLALDEDWHVWTDWYDDRLRGADHPNSRTLIEELELKRIQILVEDWKKGPKHINGMIAAWEAEYRAKPPPQRTAIIEVEYGEDGKLHRRPSGPPTARNEAQEQRLRNAWSAHSEQLATLEELDPGRNLPGLSAAMKHYRAALGSKYEAMNVISLGVHGSTIEAHAARADELLLEDAAAELVGLAAAHGLFIRQFDTWLDYVRDTFGEPTADAVEAAIGVARSTRDVPEIIDADVSDPIGELADAVEQQLTVGPEDRLRQELLRSVGNVLSGLFASAVKLVREAGSKARNGLMEGIKLSTKLATVAVTIGVSDFVVSLIASHTGEFGWITPILDFLKMKLKM